MINRLYVRGCMVVLAMAAIAQAQTFTTLYTFTGSSDGAYPYAGLIQDPSGNLYGTTSSGGYSDGGVVYKVGTAGTETVLYRFNRAFPETPLVRDRASNRYGTASDGGTSGYGVVYKIDAAGGETVLYNFTAGSDGCYPNQGLAMGESGSVFGTTSFCGSYGLGTAFKVDSSGNFTLLHSFAGYPSDGENPELGHLTMDKSGNLYGVTEGGGFSGDGVLYKLSESGRLTLLHSFGGTKDGCSPFGSVVQDKAGNLYGTSNQCGSHGYGTIWKMSKQGKETVLHNFAGGASDGCYPYAGITRDAKGNLYGVTDSCGANGYGTLYELSAEGRLALLHSFTGSDGSDPYGEVLRTPNGTLFGTTETGGGGEYCQYGCGTVWSYVP